MNDYPNCYLQVNILYAIFSSTISFYLPLPIMFYVYIRQASMKPSIRTIC